MQDYIDDLTNEVMEVLREKTCFEADSDLDDEVYSAVHEAISSYVRGCDRCG